MKIINIISNNLRKYRKKQNLTIEELSELSGLSPNFISDIEREKKSPSLNTIEKLCSALNIQFHNLFIPEKINLQIDECKTFDQFIKTIRDFPDEKKEKIIKLVLTLEKLDFF